MSGRWTKTILNALVFTAIATGARLLMPAPAAQTARTHIATGAGLPANCTVGDLFHKTGASAGTYSCDATDTWTGPLSTGGGSGSAGWVPLQQIVTSGSQATVDFTSISGSYASLKVLWSAQDTSAGTSGTNMRVRINNDATAANYIVSSRIGSQGGSGFSSQVSPTTGGVEVGFLTTAGDSGVVASGDVLLDGYAATTFHKNVLAHVYMSTSATDIVATIGSRWKSTAAVARLTFTTDGTAFVDGSTFTLFGVPANGSLGGVSTTGSPSSGQMAKFSGSSSITTAVAGTDYVAPSALSGATVSTDETTSSTTYANLATTGPSVTLTTQGTTAIVWISGLAYKTSGSVDDSFVSVDVSGASTVAASDTNSTKASAGTFTTVDHARTVILTGLTPGTNTFTLKYRTTGSTWDFLNRTIAVFAP